MPPQPVRSPAGPPVSPPLGLLLAQASQTVSRAFDDALTAARGSPPTWLILLNLTILPAGNQKALADAVGIKGATLTHHLDNMERQGLVRRESDPDNRRIQRVRLTPTGDAAFLRLRDAAMRFDHQLHQNLSARDTATIRRLLDRLRSNATGTDVPSD